MQKRVSFNVPEEYLEKMAVTAGYPLETLFDGEAGQLLTVGMVMLCLVNGIDAGYGEARRDIGKLVDAQLPYGVEEKRDVENGDSRDDRTAGGDVSV